MVNVTAPGRTPTSGQSTRTPSPHRCQLRSESRVSSNVTEVKAVDANASAESPTLAEYERCRNHPTCPSKRRVRSPIVSGTSRRARTRAGHTRRIDHEVRAALPLIVTGMDTPRSPIPIAHRRTQRTASSVLDAVTVADSVSRLCDRSKRGKFSHCHRAPLKVDGTPQLSPLPRLESKRGSRQPDTQSDETCGTRPARRGHAQLRRRLQTAVLPVPTACTCPRQRT